MKRMGFFSTSNVKKQKLKEEKEEEEYVQTCWEKESKLSIEERRERYRCGSNFIEAKDIEIWSQNTQVLPKSPKNIPKESSENKFDINEEINSKIAVYQGNMVTIEIEAIVNAANKLCLGGGGIDGAIHSAAGRKLVKECKTLHGCETGFTKITRGYNLPSKYVLHTVGPIGEDADLLQSCYHTILELVKKHDIKTLAFCGVSTGIYGYPRSAACNLALKTVRKWLEKEDNRNTVEKIIFVNFLDIEQECYLKYCQYYFPLNEEQNQENLENEDSLTGSSTDSSIESSSKDSLDDDAQEEQENKKEEKQGRSKRDA